MSRRSLAVALILFAVVLPGCGSGRAGGRAAPTPAAPAPQTTSAQISASPAVTPVRAGPVVVLDPGHNGGNAAQASEINRQVPDGRGDTKPCNTTGTAALDGYSEHEFNWDLAVRIRDALSAKGFQVVMTRPNDSGVGPCVDERAAIGNRAQAAAVVAIHADGAPGAAAHGFHVAYSAPPLNPAQGEPSIRLATTIRDRLVGAGLATSTYVGTGGLNPRADLAGLNSSERPTALVECGNMRQSDDAALLESPDGRARIAAAITEAIVGYLG